VTTIMVDDEISVPVPELKHYDVAETTARSRAALEQEHANGKIYAGFKDY
jgi:hypothetical protein